MCCISSKLTGPTDNAEAYEAETRSDYRRRMTIPEILKELEPYTGKFLMKAMREAIEQREAITRERLRVVEAIVANPTEFAHRDGYMLPVCGK